MTPVLRPTLAEDLVTMRRQYLDAAITLDADLTRAGIIEGFDHLRAVINARFATIHHDLAAVMP